MRIIQTSEFDHARASWVRPPANRACVQHQAYLKATPRDGAARQSVSQLASELLDPPVTCRAVRPPTPRGDAA